MRTEAKKPEPGTVEVSEPAYQPGRTELCEGSRLNGTVRDAMKAPVRPAKARRVMPSKRKWCAWIPRIGL